MLDDEAERTVDLGQIITVYDEVESSARCVSLKPPELWSSNASSHSTPSYRTAHPCSIKEAILTSSAKTALSTLSSSSVDEIENGLETVWKRYRKRYDIQQHCTLVDITLTR